MMGIMTPLGLAVDRMVIHSLWEGHGLELERCGGICHASLISFDRGHEVEKISGSFVHCSVGIHFHGVFVLI